MLLCNFIGSHFVVQVPPMNCKTQLNENLFLCNNAKAMKPALLKKNISMKIMEVILPGAINKINEKCPLSRPMNI